MSDDRTDADMSQTARVAEATSSNELKDKNSGERESGPEGTVSVDHANSLMKESLQCTRHVWWAPTLGVNQFKKSASSPSSKVLEFAPNAPSTEDSIASPVTTDLLANAVSKVRFTSRPDGIFACEIHYQTLPSETHRNQIERETIKLVSELLGHQHLFHHNEPAQEKLKVSVIGFVVQLALLGLALALLNLELRDYRAAISVFRLEHNISTDVFGFFSNVVPFWLSAYCALFCVVWLALASASVFLRSINTTFSKLGLLLPLHITTAIAFSIWMFAWATTNFAEAQFPKETSEGVALYRLLTELKPRLFLGQDVKLEIYNLLSTSSAAALLGVSFVPLSLFVLQYVFSISKQQHSLDGKQLVADVPRLAGGDSLPELIDNEHLLRADAAALKQVACSPLMAIKQSQLGLLRSIFAHVAEDARLAQEAAQRLSALGRLLSWMVLGIVVWLFAAVSSSLVFGDDYRQAKFGGLFLPTILTLALSVAFGVWASMSRYFIVRFCEPALVYLQKAHGYFVHMEPLPKVLADIWEKDSTLTDGFETAREIIKVKLEAAKVHLEQTRFWATFAITMTGLSTTFFLALLGALLEDGLQISAATDSTSLSIFTLQF